MVSINQEPVVITAKETPDTSLVIVDIPVCAGDTGKDLEAGQAPKVVDGYPIPYATEPPRPATAPGEKLARSVPSGSTAPFVDFHVFPERFERCSYRKPSEHLSKGGWPGSRPQI